MGSVRRESSFLIISHKRDMHAQMTCHFVAYVFMYIHARLEFKGSIWIPLALKRRSLSWGPNAATSLPNYNYLRGTLQYSIYIKCGCTLAYKAQVCCVKRAILPEFAAACLKNYSPSRRSWVGEGAYSQWQLLGGSPMSMNSPRLAGSYQTEE